MDLPVLYIRDDKIVEQLRKQEVFHEVCTSGRSAPWHDCQSCIDGRGAETYSERNCRNSGERKTRCTADCG